MNNRLVQDYLQDILDAIDKAESFMAGSDYTAFRGDEKTCFAVIRTLEIIGEAAKKVPYSLRRQHPGIPWKSLAGMRDKLIHGYFGVSTEVVWKTVTEDLPTLRNQMVDLLRQVKQREG